MVNVRSHLLHSNGPINMEIEANFIVFIFNSYLVKPIKLPFGMENYGIIIFFEKSPIKSIRIPCMIIVLSSILPSLAQTHRKMAIWMSKNCQKLEKNPKNCLFWGNFLTFKWQFSSGSCWAGLILNKQSFKHRRLSDHCKGLFFLLGLVHILIRIVNFYTSE